MPNPEIYFARMVPSEGWFCLVSGSLASIASIVILTLVAAARRADFGVRASWLIGIVGGAIGALATGFICPSDSIAHIGTWHVGIIAIAALASRLILPRFLRW
jgi:hypothetical protein